MTITTTKTNRTATTKRPTEDAPIVAEREARERRREFHRGPGAVGQPASERDRSVAVLEADIRAAAAAALANVDRLRSAIDFIAAHNALDDMGRDEFTEGSIAAGAAIADLKNILCLVRAEGVRP